MASTGCAGRRGGPRASAATARRRSAARRSRPRRRCATCWASRIAASSSPRECRRSRNSSTSGRGASRRPSFDRACCAITSISSIAMYSPHGCYPRGRRARIDDRARPRAAAARRGKTRTARLCVSILSKVLNAAVRDDLLAANPCSAVEKPGHERPPGASKRRRAGEVPRRAPGAPLTRRSTSSDCSRASHRTRPRRSRGMASTSRWASCGSSERSTSGAEATDSTRPRRSGAREIPIATDRLRLLRELHLRRGRPSEGLLFARPDGKLPSSESLRGSFRRARAGRDRAEGAAVRSAPRVRHGGTRGRARRERRVGGHGAQQHADDAGRVPTRERRAEERSRGQNRGPAVSVVAACTAAPSRHPRAPLGTPLGVGRYLA
jgi:hypothetical protein